MSKVVKEIAEKPGEWSVRETKKSECMKKEGAVSSSWSSKTKREATIQFILEVPGDLGGDCQCH